jgi:hypothetical protein
MDMNLNELGGTVDDALRAPVSESDGRKLKTARPHRASDEILEVRIVTIDPTAARAELTARNLLLSFCPDDGSALTYRKALWAF